MVSSTTAPYAHDTIQAYLNGPLVPTAQIEATGGVLKYWEHERATRPRVAQMALDFLSVPGKNSIFNFTLSAY